MTVADNSRFSSGQDVAIVGMSCLFAGAPDLETYWRNIVSKVDAISDPPSDDWDPKIFYDPDSKSNDRVYCKRGGYIGDLSTFRPMDFGVMPVTVDGGEPDQWLALRVAQEALLDAGYEGAPKEHIRTEVILGKGTYVNRGNLTVGYHGIIIDHVIHVLKNLHPEHTDEELQAVKQELKAGLPQFNADTAPALIGNIIAGRIANRLDLMGPAFTVDGACASAILAIEIGVRDLLSGKCDLVLAGGANANTPLPTLSLFCQLGALSRQERIRPFDKNADGTILGSGLGMIVLKRKADAERDGNRIYASVKGVGVASDGRAVHVMAPRLEGEALALRRAYEMAGLSPETVGLIEAHGTATPLGDLVEVQALAQVFGGRKGALPTCALGSVKSMIGHTMPAAGIAGVIKAALSLHHRVLPPTLNCDEPNPALQLEKTPFYVNTETRPWIHGADTPRRAGVNSFGFGGINGHVVLEEYESGTPQKHCYLTDWESEVCILEAASRADLIGEGTTLAAFLKRSQAGLKDIAFTLNTGLGGSSVRLAIVADSKEDLEQKLAHAMTRLADPRCKQIKDNQGIYFFDKPLEGKLAFVFPGEGAQYPNMLLDLCLHFPEVRNCFDLADKAIFRRSRKMLPSEFIYPRATMPEAERTEVDRALWQIDGAVEGVLISNWAMWTLLKQLEIRPDVIMGHSTGDYSAMFASNIIGLTSQEDFVGTIVAWNEAHGRLSTQMKVPKVVLVAVAADADTVMSIVREIGGDLHLAMDNCPHQSVLLGSEEHVEKAVERLRRQGLMYEILPFDRPYHTPLFRDYAVAAGLEFLSRVPLSTPKIETYSCTTASPYPADLDRIREIFISHWMEPVLFRQTIETMYKDGVRIFVESGARGNLVAFISDILRGKPHLAMPANLARRSGVTQLNHLVGVLAAQGVAMRADYLYTRRDPKIVPWRDTEAAAEPRVSPAMKVALGMPPLRVAARPKPAPRAEPQPSVAASPAPKSTPAPTNPAASAMQQYVKGMEEFLNVEQNVMEAFLNRARLAATNRSGGAGVPTIKNYPLLGTVKSLMPGQELSASRRLSLHEDRFLREHALGGPVSLYDSELRPLIVLPLTMTMEIMAEAAALLSPGQVLVGMRDIQAYRWIEVDETATDVHVRARRVKDSLTEAEVEVEISNSARHGDNATVAARGTMIFGAALPKPPAVPPFALAGERTSSLRSAQLYGTLMFHGPVFQGVSRVERSSPDGVIASLRTLPTGDLFRSNRDPQFVVDPVALDAAGQSIGFWAAEYLKSGFVVFPNRLESLRVFGPRRPAGEALICNAKLELLGNERIRSNIDIVGADGTLWMRLKGWEDRRFDPPAQFHRAWVSPRTAMISEPGDMPLPVAPERRSFECRRVGKLFEGGGALWTQLWASLILSREERNRYRERKEPDRQRLEWLSGRTAAKDAVRVCLQKKHGLELLPADIEIAEDEHGKLTARGQWTEHLREIPEVSLTYSDGAAVALAGFSSQANLRVNGAYETDRMVGITDSGGKGR